ncbi:hypothetical protein ECZU34_23830 [Escherichia coli]|nr:hypothetical protein ECZU34_23830 [Escherichia coli]
MLEEYKKVVNSGDGDAVKGTRPDVRPPGRKVRNGLAGSSAAGQVSPPSGRCMI